MKSIIGLFSYESAVNPAVERLKDAGIAGDQISILSNPKTIDELFGCDPVCVIKNYTVWGILIGIGTYAIFGAAAALCQCNLMQYGQVYGIGTFLGAILAGAFVGGVIGVLVGAGEAEKDTHLYVQGVHLGGRVISIQVPDENVEPVKQILAEENVTGVKVLKPVGG